MSRCQRPLQVSRGTDWLRVPRDQQPGPCAVPLLLSGALLMSCGDMVLPHGHRGLSLRPAPGQGTTVTRPPESRDPVRGLHKHRAPRPSQLLGPPCHSAQGSCHHDFCLL